MTFNPRSSSVLSSKASTNTFHLQSMSARYPWKIGLAADLRLIYCNVSIMVSSVCKKSVYVKCMIFIYCYCCIFILRCVPMLSFLYHYFCVIIVLYIPCNSNISSSSKRTSSSFSGVVELVK